MLTTINTLPGLPAALRVQALITGSGRGFGAFFSTLDETPLASSGVYPLWIEPGVVVITPAITDPPCTKLIEPYLKDLAQGLLAHQPPFGPELAAAPVWTFDASQLTRDNRFSLLCMLPGTENVQVEINVMPHRSDPTVTLPGRTCRVELTESGERRYRRHDGAPVSERERTQLGEYLDRWQAHVADATTEAAQILRATRILRSLALRHAHQTRLHQEQAMLARMQQRVQQDIIDIRLSPPVDYA